MQFLHAVCKNKDIQKHAANENTEAVLHGYCFRS